jgi:hypothetical protein
VFSNRTLHTVVKRVESQRFRRYIEVQTYLLDSYSTFLPTSARAFRSVVDRLLCMLKVKGSNPLMSIFFAGNSTLNAFFTSTNQIIRNSDRSCTTFQIATLMI